MELLGWWDEQSPRNRVLIIAGAAFITALSIVAAVLVLSRVQYELLFSELAPQDLNVIAGALSEDGIPYRIDGESGSILVAHDHALEARVRVMERGLPLVGRVGFELFDDVDFGMTDFTQQINYQRALEGELERTIMALDEVRHARLHLVLPDQTVFRRDKGAPKASLTLILKDGVNLTTERTEGIRLLVAASVPDLEKESVTIVDHRGVDLGGSSSQASRVPELIKERMEAKRVFESQLERKLIDLLGGVFGLRDVDVVANAELDYDLRRISRHAPVTAGEGITGAVARMRTTSPSSIGAPQGRVQDIEYRLGESVEEREVAPGNVRRLSVGVVVPAGTDAEMREMIVDLVARAAGVEHERGDQVSVQAIGQTQDMGLEQTRTRSGVDGSANAGKKAWRPPGNSWVLLGFAIGTAFLVGLIVAMLVLRRRPRRMSDAERRQLVHELESWLEVRGDAGARE